LAAQARASSTERWLPFVLTTYGLVGAIHNSVVYRRPVHIVITLEAHSQAR
jgi:hypothetical protein